MYVSNKKNFKKCKLSQRSIKKNTVDIFMDKLSKSIESWCKGMSHNYKKWIRCKILNSSKIVAKINCWTEFSVKLIFLSRWSKNVFCQLYATTQ